jgi:carbon monoxide dehydrogenase subunit G
LYVGSQPGFAGPRRLDRRGGGEPVPLGDSYNTGYGRKIRVKLSGEFRVEAPPQDVWNVLLDPNELCGIMPGCREARQVDDNAFESLLAVKVQMVTIRARVRGELQEMDEPHRVVVHLVGDAFGVTGAFEADSAFDFVMDGDGTHAGYSFDVTLFGRLAALGEYAIRATAERLAREFGENLVDHFAPGEQLAVIGV